ncbi:MAG: hypothetical protein J6Q52_04625 [Clostridia bacterium]|nr:hypothetical protein [Clostridia bacterium]
MQIPVKTTVRKKTAKIVPTSPKRDKCVVSGHIDDVPLWWKVADVHKMTFNQLRREKGSLEREVVGVDKRRRQAEKDYVKYNELLLRERDTRFVELNAIEENIELIKQESTLRMQAVEREQEIELINVERDSLERIEAEKVEHAKRLREITIEETQRAEDEHRDRLSALREDKLEAIRVAEQTELDLMRAREETSRIEAQRIATQDQLALERAEIRERKAQEKIAEKKLKQIEEEKVRQREEQAEIDRLEQSRVNLRKKEEERQRYLNQSLEEKKKREKEDEERAKQRESMEKKRIQRLKRRYRIRDVVFNPYPLSPDDNTSKCALQLRDLSLLVRKGETSVIEGVDLDVIAGETTIVDRYTLAEADVIISMIQRNFSSRYILKGGEIFLLGEAMLGIKAREHFVKTNREISVVPSELISADYRDMTVYSYIKKICTKSNVSRVRDILVRLHLTHIDKIMRKRISRCTYSEIAKIAVVTALYSGKKVVVLNQPERCLDALSILTLRDIIKQWRETSDSALVIFGCRDQEGGVAYV